MSTPWLRIVFGAICGVVATGPMTAAMIAWHRRLPEREKYPLPPREITGEVLAKAGVQTSAEAAHAATALAHFAYGGAAGAVYGLCAGRGRSIVRAGLGLGTAVWALSYFGLLPALGILRPASEHPVRRSALMLGAHFVWGLCVSALQRVLLEDTGRPRPALRQRATPARDLASPAEVRPT